MNAIRDMKTHQDEVLLLRIRNLIAAREFNTAEANRELHSGDGWLSDHAGLDRELDAEIDALFKRLTIREVDNGDQ